MTINIDSDTRGGEHNMIALAVVQMLAGRRGSTFWGAEATKQQLLAQANKNADKTSLLHPPPPTQ